MLKSIYLRDVGPSREMKLDLAPRLNVLTGDNGLGKSFILDIAWWAMTRTWPKWPSQVAQPRRGANVDPAISVLHTERGDRTGTVDAHYSFDEQEWSAEYCSERPDPGLIIYARADGSFSVWDTARLLKQDQRNEHRDIRPPAIQLAPRQVWDGYKDEGLVLCKGLIEDWANWQQAQKRPFDALHKVLRKMSPDEEEVLEPGEPVRVSIQDVRDVPTLRTAYGDVPVTLVSAGVRRIIAMAYVLVWAWNEHRLASELLNRPADHRILFLIDEIEAHLHPKWQRTLLRSLLPIADELREGSGHGAACQILTTTHAPLVMASLEPIFEPQKDRVFNFDLVDADVQVSEVPWRPRGDASSWLTSEVFDLGQARSLDAEKAIARAMEAMRRPDLALEEARKIHTELHRVLKDSDPFWVRWRYRAEQAGLET